MKAERFITEYANYEKRKLKSAFKLYGNEACTAKIKYIDMIVGLRMKGLITAGEAVKMISKTVW